MNGDKIRSHIIMHSSQTINSGSNSTRSFLLNSQQLALRIKKQKQNFPLFLRITTAAAAAITTTKTLFFKTAVFPRSSYPFRTSAISLVLSRDSVGKWVWGSSRRLEGVRVNILQLISLHTTLYISLSSSDLWDILWWSLRLTLTFIT